MITVKDALETILSGIRALPPEKARLIDAAGRTLAEDVYSDINIPQLDNSAMDGYAVRSSDTAAASRANPTEMDVIAVLKAGTMPTVRVKRNKAVRIMTGASVPEGADSIVIVEDTEKLCDSRVKIFAKAKPGDHIRKAGEGIKKGEKVIAKGTPLLPSHLGVLASLGKSCVKVTKKPRVSILATGDEIIDINEKLMPGKLRSSNTYSLYGQVASSGGVPKNLGIVADEPVLLEKKIKNSLDCDILITSGGVSAGDYDYVKRVLKKLGTRIKFWKVAMRPGKPLVFGFIKGRPVFGLPGNPVSSMISFEVFVKPAILKMLGRDMKKEARLHREALLSEDIKKKKGIRYFLRAKTKWQGGKYVTRTTGPQGSGILKSMVLADSLMVLPEEAEILKKGTMAKVIFI